jgi:hypothetical protein
VHTVSRSALQLARDFQVAPKKVVVLNAFATKKAIL